MPTRTLPSRPLGPWAIPKRFLSELGASLVYPWASASARKSERRDSGLCVDCGEGPPMPDEDICLDCRLERMTTI